MDRGQVQAIQHLVAAAVAGLTPDRVAIVDDRGNLLAGGDDKSGPDAARRRPGPEHHRLRRPPAPAHRIHRRQRGRRRPCPRPGRRRHELQPHQHHAAKTYDPDSKVVRSTQTVEQNATDTTGSSGSAVSVANALPGGASRGAGGDDSKSTSGRTEETTNYEISKTVTTCTVDGGDVKKLSVAVVVDGSRRHGRRLQAAHARRDEADHRSGEIGDGLRRQRAATRCRSPTWHSPGSTTADGTPAPKPLLGLDSSYWFKIIEAAIMCVTALLIGLFVARPLISRMFAPRSTPGGAAGAGQRLAGRRRACPRPAGGADAPAGAARQPLPCPRRSP